MKTILEIVKEEEKIFNQFIESEYLNRQKEHDNQIKEFDEKIIYLRSRLCDKKKDLENYQNSYFYAKEIRINYTIFWVMIFVLPVILFLIFYFYFNWMIFFSIIGGVFIPLFPMGIILQIMQKKRSNYSKEDINDFLIEIEKLKLSVNQIQRDIDITEKKLKKERSNTISKQDIRDKYKIDDIKRLIKRKEEIKEKYFSGHRND